MLADIQNGIGRLLTTTGNSEAQIRKVLQERYEAGVLRKETFQLVKSMLDRTPQGNLSARQIHAGPLRDREHCNQPHSGGAGSRAEQQTAPDQSVARIRGAGG